MLQYQCWARYKVQREGEEAQSSPHLYPLLSHLSTLPEARILSKCFDNPYHGGAWITGTLPEHTNVDKENGSKPVLILLKTLMLVWI